MQQALLSKALLTKAIHAEVKSISIGKRYAEKKQPAESFLHQLFFGKQPLHTQPVTDSQKKWSDPNEFNSYE